MNDEERSQDVREGEAEDEGKKEGDEEKEEGGGTDASGFVAFVDVPSGL